MTERLYYNDSFLYDFRASVLDTRELKRDGNQSTWAVKLDRTAFYPTSGGQPFDTGRLTTESKSGVPLEVAVDDVFEDEEEGEVWHRVAKVLPPGAKVRGLIDAERRRDHMQQHTGQHLLSAAFVQLLNAKTVSFHLGEEISTIDIDLPTASRDDLVRVERLSNEVIAQDRAIAVRYATREEAAQMGVRKLPEREGEIRLIDIKDFDLNACGGTHAQSTGQIGGLLIRRTEKVKQGLRIEFVCGLRATKVARRDFEILSEASALYPCAPGDLPANIGKQREEARVVQKREGKLLEELAELKAAQLIHETANKPAPRVIVQVFEDRDANFAKLLAQKLTKSTAGMIALLASAQTPPALVFARSSDLTPDMGSLLRELVTAAGGRGGGGKDFAQGGVPDKEKLRSVLEDATRRVA
ncbi:MAG TPA: DHHA1 domain-containing protein [Terriglobales bacterium]|jgi:alanyl-tRNA synthetase|nr:DHHA1 domain-containing protein [Terriglobales bacterium]